MNIFLSDLDNTLIYSHRRTISGKKSVSEYLDGREQSYVTEKTLLLLRTFCSIEGNILVPLTTRTYSQYARISPLTERLGVRYALTTNGAVLTESGISDPLWERESQELAEPFYEEMLKCSEIMKQYTEDCHVHFIEPYLVYTKPEQPEAVMKALESEGLSDGMDMLLTSGKLYCLPKALSKGNAAKRFLRRFPQRETRLIAAGDSVFDISMLAVSDISFAPESIELPPDMKPCIRIGGLFSNGIGERLIELC